MSPDRPDLMMASVLVVTVIGLKVVGLVLIVALSDHPAGRGAVLDRSGRAHDLDFAGRHRRAVRAMSARRCRPPRRTFRPGRSSSSSRRPSSLRRCSSRRCAGLAAAALRTGTSRRGCTSGRACWRSPGRSRSARPTPCACCSARACPARWRADETRGARRRPRSRAMNAAGRSRAQIHQDAGLTGRYDGLTPIEDVFTADEIPISTGGSARPCGRGVEGLDGGRIRPVLADADPDRYPRIHRLRTCRGTS
jgi:manganese/zinc/iron transport system permease protein